MTEGKRGESSLREFKKNAAREALSRAAVRLVVERGLENVRVEDIAAEVGVSPRTFNNYFSSKEEAVCSVSVDRRSQLLDALRARPEDEPVIEAVTGALLGLCAAGAPDVAYLARVRAATQNPGVWGEYLKAHVAVEEAMTVEIARRSGTDPETDLFPRLLAGAVSSAMRVAIGHWSEQVWPGSFSSLVAHVLDQLLAGMPEPAKTEEPGAAPQPAATR
ncbi:TetR/AcrR family transcriptional regulator [Amycolatopsis minnesotensis]|uniref:TetR/AcrR family transcriptional regulator n=1 Tax=Amycolatopsis minnesotensis TaxID=337894 RepID=UPI0031DBC2AE